MEDGNCVLSSNHDKQLHDLSISWYILISLVIDLKKTIVMDFKCKTIHVFEPCIKFSFDFLGDLCGKGYRFLQLDLKYRL